MLRRQRNLPVSRRRPAPTGDGAATPRRRSGLTLVEMMVAVVVLSVGLLGIAGTSGVITRQIGAGTKQSAVAQVMANRLERLRSLDCSRIEDGTATSRAITESWTRGSTVNGVLFVTNTVTYRVGGDDHAKSYTQTITVPCQ